MILPVAAAGYRGASYVLPHSLRTCWLDGCSKSVEPTDELGLCADCVKDLREATK